MKRLIPIFGALLASLSLIACTDVQNTERLLADQGYTEVRAGGYDWLACSEDDTYRTHFTATSPTGTPVSGTVCAGMLFKGKTVRFD